MEEDEGTFSDMGGPLDQTNPVPFQLILDDNQRRNILITQAYEQIIGKDPETGELRVIGQRAKYESAAALIGIALSTQNNLLDLSPQKVQAKKIEFDMMVKNIGIVYRRNAEVRTAIRAAQYAYNSTLDGMSEQGTFSLFMKGLTGSIREVISGVRGVEKK